MSHTCHAVDCGAKVPPEMLMCRLHWFMVPKPLRDRVWQTYRAGQCDDWNPSNGYCNAAQEAVIAVAKLEGKVNIEDRPEVKLYDFFKQKETGEG